MYWESYEMGSKYVIIMCSCIAKMYFCKADCRSVQSTHTEFDEMGEGKALHGMYCRFVVTLALFFFTLRMLLFLYPSLHTHHQINFHLSSFRIQ